MIRAAKLNTAAGTVPFGSIASVVGDKLVGKRAVNIGENGGRPAIRITAGGKKLWLRLDAFEAGLEAIGYGAALDQVATASEDGSSSDDSMGMNVVNTLSWVSVLETPERPRDSGFPTEKGLSSATAPISYRESVLETPLAAEPPTLSERITRLGAQRRAAEHASAERLASLRASGIDPSPPNRTTMTDTDFPGRFPEWRSFAVSPPRREPPVTACSPATSRAGTTVSPCSMPSANGWTTKAASPMKTRAHVTDPRRPFRRMVLRGAMIALALPLPAWMHENDEARAANAEWRAEYLAGRQAAA